MFQLVKIFIAFFTLFIFDVDYGFMVNFKIR